MNHLGTVQHVSRGVLTWSWDTVWWPYMWAPPEDASFCSASWLWLGYWEEDYISVCILAAATRKTVKGCVSQRRVCVVLGYPLWARMHRPGSSTVTYSSLWLLGVRGPALSLHLVLTLGWQAGQRVKTTRSSWCHKQDEKQIHTFIVIILQSISNSSKYLITCCWRVFWAFLLFTSFHHLVINKDICYF